MTSPGEGRGAKLVKKRDNKKRGCLQKVMSLHKKNRKFLGWSNDHSRITSPGEGRGAKLVKKSDNKKRGCLQKVMSPHKKKSQVLVLVKRTYFLNGPLKKFYYSKKSVKKMFLQISHNSQENTCAILLKKRLWPAILLKNRLWHRCFPVNLVKSLRTPFLKEHLQCLLLTCVFYLC